MKSLLLLSAFICTTLSAAAQVYQPFPTNDAHWRTRNNQNDTCFDNIYYVNGTDTIIKGLKYTKVFARTAATPFGGPPNFTMPEIKNRIAIKPDAYVYGIREDNKKIYTIRKKDTTEYLYFDFGLTIGDTVATDYFSMYKWVITGIDSVKVGAPYHKRYRITYISGGVTYHNYVVEGIGYDRHSPFDILNGQNYTRLHCFTNSQGTYTLDTFKCTYIFPYGTPTAINNTVANKPANIHPNPFSNQLTIDADAAFVKLTDAIGKVVITQSGSNNTINTTNLPAGLYILTLQDKDGNITERRKLIKE